MATRSKSKPNLPMKPAELPENTDQLLESEKLPETVKVTWEDAYASHGPPPEELRPHLRVSVGFRVPNDSGFVVLASTYDSDGGDDYLAIPDALVKSIIPIY